jgi:hypothetical protein
LLTRPQQSSLSLCSSSESRSHLSRPGGVCSTSGTSLAVSSPSTFSRFQAATQPGGNQPPVCCPRSVSHALRALIRPEPAGLISCRSRPWGLHPPGFIPPAEPHVLSNAVALLWLVHLLVAASSRRSMNHPGDDPLRATAFLLMQPRERQAPLQGLAPRERPFSQLVV